MGCRGKNGPPLVTWKAIKPIFIEGLRSHWNKLNLLAARHEGNPIMKHECPQVLFCSQLFRFHVHPQIQYQINVLILSLGPIHGVGP